MLDNLITICEAVLAITIVFGISKSEWFQSIIAG